MTRWRLLHGLLIMRIRPIWLSAMSADTAMNAVHTIAQADTDICSAQYAGALQKRMAIATKENTDERDTDSDGDTWGVDVCPCGSDSDPQ